MAKKNKGEVSQTGGLSVSDFFGGLKNIDDKLAEFHRLLEVAETEKSSYLESFVKARGGVSGPYRDPYTGRVVRILPRPRYERDANGELKLDENGNRIRVEGEVTWFIVGPKASVITE